MADFSSPDFLRLDETQFSDEEITVRESVREWVSKEFLPRVQEHVRQDGSFPMELAESMAELGMFGANLGFAAIECECGGRFRHSGAAVLRRSG